MVLPKKVGRTKMPITWIKSDASRHVTFTKRKKGLKKKVEELAILCGVEVCMICFAPQAAAAAAAEGSGRAAAGGGVGGGAPYSWGLPGVAHVINKYRSLSKEEQDKKKLDNSSLLEQQIKKLKAELKLKSEQNLRLQRQRSYLLWDDRLNSYSPDHLRLLADAVHERASAASDRLRHSDHDGVAADPLTPPPLPRRRQSPPPSAAVVAFPTLPSSTRRLQDHHESSNRQDHDHHQLLVAIGDGIDIDSAAASAAAAAAAADAYDGRDLLPDANLLAELSSTQQLQPPFYYNYNPNLNLLSYCTDAAENDYCEYPAAPPAVVAPPLTYNDLLRSSFDSAADDCKPINELSAPIDFGPSSVQLIASAANHSPDIRSFSESFLDAAAAAACDECNNGDCCGLTAARSAAFLANLPLLSAALAGGEDTMAVADMAAALYPQLMQVVGDGNEILMGAAGEASTTSAKWWQQREEDMEMEGQGGGGGRWAETERRRRKDSVMSASSNGHYPNNNNYYVSNNSNDITTSSRSSTSSNNNNNNITPSNDDCNDTNNTIDHHPAMATPITTTTTSSASLHAEEDVDWNHYLPSSSSSEYQSMVVQVSAQNHDPQSMVVQLGAQTLDHPSSSKYPSMGVQQLVAQQNHDPTSFFAYPSIVASLAQDYGCPPPFLM